MPLWTRCSGFESTLAPESKSSVTPFGVGIGVAMVGRPIPLMRRRMSCAAVTAAPVLPADSTASQTPSLTRRVATTMDASFFVRTASAGCSPISMTCEA